MTAEVRENPSSLVAPPPGRLPDSASDAESSTWAAAEVVTTMRPGSVEEPSAISLVASVGAGTPGSSWEEPWMTSCLPSWTMRCTREAVAPTRELTYTAGALEAPEPGAPAASPDSVAGTTGDWADSPAGSVTVKPGCRPSTASDTP